MTFEIDQITSASNPLIKQIRSLERKKERQETGLFLVEGARLIDQALSQNWQIETLIITAQGLERAHSVALARRAAQSGARIVQVPERLAAQITHKDNPQTVFATLHQRPLELTQFKPPARALYLGLYTVRDPGNLGTIIRTADCAGLSGIVLIGQCCDPYSIEAVRASMGSLFDMPLAQTDVESFMAWLQASQMRMTGASMHGQQAHTEVDFTGPSLILMGNEQSGLPQEVEAQCDTLCRIPMRGGADSLNLAQASGILIYEAWRQRGFS